MSNPKFQAFANRYVADLIANAPPNEVDFLGAEFSAADRVALYRVLEKIRDRLLAEAELLENLPLTHRHLGTASSAQAR